MQSHNTIIEEESTIEKESTSRTRRRSLRTLGKGLVGISAVAGLGLVGSADEHNRGEPNWEQLENSVRIDIESCEEAVVIGAKPLAEGQYQIKANGAYWRVDGSQHTFEWGTNALEGRLPRFEFNYTELTRREDTVASVIERVAVREFWNWPEFETVEEEVNPDYEECRDDIIIG